MDTFGDKLFKRVMNSRNLLFLHGEIAQLTYQSFDKYVQLINETKETTIEVTVPIGYSPDNTPINTTYKYTKENLIARYQYLGLNQLPINGIYQLVTTIEALFGDILRETLIEFPIKISNKRKLDFELVLEAKSLEEIKFALVNTVINELAYKSPKDFAEEFNKYIGINLLEKPVFHKYIELKATRDIYIHNQGIANEIYLAKADTLARVKSGQFLPVDIQYFLQSYECCLQITEILEEALNKIWPSIEYQKSKTKKAKLNETNLVKKRNPLEKTKPKRKSKIKKETNNK
ncbi:hypothetical protein CYCD_11870 [Tenuifilaceae bacterium CYCD]|nr:hypothetical protein CYCD_11870 [Tenuifilaceae bacterium CYCD]